ncbi:MAG: flavin reductase [Rhodanobacter sp.]|nr:MAG: flavin reductase [Rhodanobacter sp.]
MTGIASFDPRDFRQALGAFATGVTIVTACAEDGTPVGITANSFSSVSLDPPMVLWSLARSARSLPVFERTSHWNVHVLANDQEAMSNRFARAGEDKFSGLELDAGASDAPLIPGCSARFQCRTAFQYEGGDHVIFVGEVIDYDRTPSPPLLYVTGGYALAARKAGAVATETELPDAIYSENMLGYLLGRAHFQFVAGFRHTLDEHGLSDTDFFVLSLLSVRQPLSVEEIAAHMAYTGADIGPVALQSLRARGLLEHDAKVGGWRLGAHGGYAILHVLAAAKSVEADALERLDPMEAVGLRNLLKRLIAVTDPGLPKLWTSPLGGEPVA